MDMPKKFYFTEISGSYAAGEPYRKFRPKESFEYLGNPHKGLETFQHFNGDPLFPGITWKEEGPHEFEFIRKNPAVVKGHLPSTVCYNRWNWATFEPKEGEFDFSVIEDSLKVAKLRGQTLHVRLMPYSGGAGGSPELPEWYRQRYKVRRVGVHWEPEHNSKEYFRLWGGLIERALRIYGKHPDIDIIDTAFNGQWGEGAGDMNFARCREFTELYLKYVPAARLVVDGGHEMVTGAKRGTGWRMNCFGDMRNYGHGIVPDGLGWNHHFESYPERVIEAGASDSWKRAPVVFETCYNPARWYKDGMPLEYLDFILQQGLKFHCSLFMPKYSLIPGTYRTRLMKFVNQIGYRYVLRTFKYNRNIDKNGKFLFDMWIENVGAAPLYRDWYAPALRFRQGKRTEIVRLRQDMRKWLPGDIWIKEHVQVPKEFRHGKMQVAVALVNKATEKPTVKFASEGAAADGWHPMGEIIKA